MFRLTRSYSIFFFCGTVNFSKKKKKNWEKEFSGFFLAYKCRRTGEHRYFFFAVFTFYPFRIYQKSFIGIIQYFVVFLTPRPMHELE